MNNKIADQPVGSTPLDDISGLLRDDITTRTQLDEAETLNILNAVDWIASGHLGDLFAVDFLQKLHAKMFNEVWQWAGVLRSLTGARPNVGVSPERVPAELERITWQYRQQWEGDKEGRLIDFVARYHHALVLVHPFNNGNGRWARLACDAVVRRLFKAPPIIWATDTLNVDSDERKRYIAALKQADVYDHQPLIDYLMSLNPGR